jgi:F0F1-type ATP synthase membrane subunit b/b'
VLLLLQEARERLRQQAYESVSAARSRIRRSASESIAEAQARIAAEDAAALADVHKVGTGFAACVCFVEGGGVLGQW